ncbi:hypothetical protein ZIOFF_024837 [Zingiber officinale]|uniref:Uncharacterized protein n=1 Tax=Zingiber officinale TaxID=94328 RepID=A0A8J5GT31_ZINOF|nr:hypothetical protein ZIOFF_024837 [Zingiber officinale]
MLSLRGFWSRHRRKILVSLGIAGGGYFLYKLYESQARRFSDSEQQLEGARQVDELIKNQLQVHFENIQRISDTTTLPYAMHCLQSSVSENLDLSPLTDKLIHGKGQSSALPLKEKLELWERLKILSFTRAAASLWSMTLLCLYVRVQVNILGRQLYLDIARDFEDSQPLRILSQTEGMVSPRPLLLLAVDASQLLPISNLDGTRQTRIQKHDRGMDFSTSLEITNKLVLAPRNSPALDGNMSLACSIVEEDGVAHSYQVLAKKSSLCGDEDEVDSFKSHGRQAFLATADYLATYGINSLIMNMQNAAMEVLKDKQLKETISMAQLCEIMIQILDMFMNIGSLNYWITYLVPENVSCYKQQIAMSANGFEDASLFMDATKLDQLLFETRSVLSRYANICNIHIHVAYIFQKEHAGCGKCELDLSMILKDLFQDFGKIVDISLKKVVEVLVNDISVQVPGTSSVGVPLAKLLPQITRLSLPLLDEPRRNKFVQVIQNLPEVELFYTLLYANMPTDSNGLTSV